MGRKLNIKNKKLSLLKTSHGLSGSRIYNIWSLMKRRCSNKNIKSSKNYVYKGITVCEEWQKFENFYRDMSDTYQENLTLDRINNALGYNKKNCQWVTKQKNSQKTSRVTFYKGLSARETSLLLGGNEDLVSSRLRAGWDIERAFTQKKNERKLL